MAPFLSPTRYRYMGDGKVREGVCVSKKSVKNLKKKSRGGESVRMCRTVSHHTAAAITVSQGSNKFAKDSLVSSTHRDTLIALPMNRSSPRSPPDREGEYLLAIKEMT